MRNRLILRLLILAVVIEFAMPVIAGEPGSFFSSIARDTKRRNCWPEPFVYPDRQLARQAWAVEICAGWERQNLLSEFHFSADGRDLTEAGKMRVQWIVNEAPEPHRQIFVHRGNTPQETITRIQIVQRLVAQMPYAANVPVVESTRTDDGTPAVNIDTVSRKAATAALDPKLLGASASGAGASSGGSH